jgi:hypothetical protein
MGTRFTRWRFLTALSAGAAYLALTNTVGSRPRLRLLPHQLHRHRARRQPAPPCPKYLDRIQGRAQQRRGLVATRREEERLRDGSWYQDHLPARGPPPESRHHHHRGNGAHPKEYDRSRGIVVELDKQKMSTKLLREYTAPEKTLATSQGNMQLLPNSNVFVGWAVNRLFPSSPVKASCS